MNYVYILRCRDGTLYTGWTNDLQKRIAAHSAGRGAKYTKARLPVILIYNEVFATKQEAMQREYAVKQLSRQQKLTLISNRSEQNAAACYTIKYDDKTAVNSK